MIKRSAIKPVSRLMLKELVVTLLLLFGVSMVVFAILSFAPGNPFESIVQKTGEAGKRQGFLSGSLQYLAWLGCLVKGDLGNSVRTGLPVLEQVISTGINTLLLTMGSILLSLAIVIPVAVSAARSAQGTIMGKGMTILIYGISALPSFWFGYIVIYISMRHFGLFPLAFGGMSGQNAWIYFLLPVVVMVFCATGMSEMIRYLREELTRVLAQDYIRTAKAKGASVWKHAFKEGFVIPITDMVASRIPYLLGGAVVVEQIFNWPGMGRLAWQAAQDRDFPLIMGITLMAAVLVRVGSLLKNMIQIMVNPRMSQPS